MMPIFEAEKDGKTFEIDAPDQAKAIEAIKSFTPQQKPQERGVMDKLLGLTGERYQTWPERLIRAPFEAVQTGAELTKSAMTGEYGPTGQFVTQEDPGKILQASSLGLGAAPTAAEGVAGAGLAAERATAKKAALPSKDEYRAAAKAAYKQIEENPVTLPPESIQLFTEGARADLDSKLFTEIESPRTFKAVSQIEKSGGNLAKIMDIYSALGQIPSSSGADFAAAQLVRSSIDEQMEGTFVGTMWDSARASWRTFSQLDQIDKLMAAGERRAATTGTGANTQNAVRQNVRRILDSDQRSRGFSKDAKDQIENVVMGTWLTNTARYVGKFAPSGPVSMASTLTAGLTGLATGGAETGAIAAAAVAIPTTVAKYLGQYLTQRQIQKLEEIIRSEAPQGRAAVKAVGERPPSPDIQSLELGTRALAPGAGSALAEPPQSR